VKVAIRVRLLSEKGNESENVRDYRGGTEFRSARCPLGIKTCTFDNVVDTDV
jgi:hypothetical protein